MNDFIVKTITVVVIVVALGFVAYIAMYMKRDGHNMIEPTRFLAISLLTVTSIAAICFCLFPMMK